MPPHPPPPAPGRDPDFLVIGAQKCATGWLFHHLSRHPDVWMPPDKELEFFSYADHLLDPGLDAYRARFAEAGDARAVGEATPSYFWTPTDSDWSSTPPGFQADIPATVHDALGSNLRLLVLLRDPADRALSAWAHYVAHGELDPDAPFQAAARYGGVVEMGFYATHLSRWRDRFDADRFLVLSVESDVRRHGADTLRRTASFLGVDPARFPDSTTADIVFGGATRIDDGHGGIRFEPPAIHPDRPVPTRGLSAREWRDLRALYFDEVRRLDAMTGRSFASLWGYDGNSA